MMKISTASLAMLSVPMMLCLSGCLDEEVRTIIAPDGSSTRVISMKLPTRNLPASMCPAVSDSSWAVEWKELTGKDAKFECVARKTFPTPEALQSASSGRADSGAMGVSVSLRKSFQWFFTYFDYQETFTFRNPYADIPVSRYLTNEEVARFQRGADADTLKRKVERWYARVQFEFMYERLVAEAVRRSDPAVPAQLLMARKDEYFDLLTATDSANKAAKAESKDSVKHKLDSGHDMLQLLAGIIGSDGVFGLEPAADAALSDLEQQEAAMKHPDSWVYAVEMPGLLLDTNSDIVEGNSSAWKFTPDQVRIAPYVMRASSRISNLWAFIATGVALVVLTLIAVRQGRQKRRRPS